MKLQRGDAIRRAPADEYCDVSPNHLAIRAGRTDSRLRGPGPFLRDIYGNRFHSPIIECSWLSPEIVYFARKIYEGGTCEWMAELADMLQEPGCTDPVILEHARARQ
jgi:hypothetical protein